MEAGKAQGRPRASGWSRTVNFINPLRAVWWLFTNVRFAIVLLLLLALISLVGVIVPQMPANVRGDAILETAWLNDKSDDYGFLADPMEAIGLFTLFQQRWFSLLLAVTVVSTAAYVVSRVPGVWGSISRPRKRVPDRYFEMAPARVGVDARVEPERLESLLAGRRYKVERYEEEGTTYLFADRFQVAQLGTLLTHIAVIVFILSAVVSRVDAFESGLFIAEGTTLPVFALSDPNQMQVELENTHAEFLSDGQPVDYRADLVIYDRGEEALRCSSTVNTPCEYNGYRFFQAAYFGFGAEVLVRDLASGNAIYRETLALASRSPSPRVEVVDSDGNVLLDQTVVLPEAVPAEGRNYNAGLAELSDGRILTFWLAEDASADDELLVFEPSGGDAVRAELGEGESTETGGLTVTYLNLENVPSALVPDFPLPDSLGGVPGDTLIEMTNVVFGSEELSSGDTVASAYEGEPTLTLIGLQSQPITLTEGDSAVVDDLEYTFEGQREFSGINVRRDRSDNLVWIGAAMIVLGLMITFWVPRRRLWAKISAGRTSLAGQAPGHANYNRELRDLAREAGAPLSEEPDDDD